MSEIQITGQNVAIISIFACFKVFTNKIAITEIKKILIQNIIYVNLRCEMKQRIFVYEIDFKYLFNSEHKNSIL